MQKYQGIRVRYKVSIKERKYVCQESCGIQIYLTLPLCSVLWYQVGKQKLCKSNNDRFSIETVVR
jgi:hypothetical protein